MAARRLNSVIDTDIPRRLPGSRLAAVRTDMLALDPSPARLLQESLAAGLVPAFELQRGVLARLAIITGLAIVSWSVFGGGVYLIVR